MHHLEISVVLLLMLLSSQALGLTDARPHMQRGTDTRFELVKYKSLAELAGRQILILSVTRKPGSIACSPRHSWAALERQSSMPVDSAQMMIRRMSRSSLC